MENLKDLYGRVSKTLTPEHYRRTPLGGMGHGKPKRRARLANRGDGRQLASIVKNSM